LGEGEAFLQPEAVPNTFLALKEAIDNVGDGVVPHTGQFVMKDGYYDYYSMDDWNWSKHPGSETGLCSKLRSEAGGNGGPAGQ
jgi:hypothetical protein